MALFAGEARAQQFVTDGLISFWTFDEATVTVDTVEDTWGNNNATIMGDTTTGDGKIGQALECDGGSSGTAWLDHCFVSRVADNSLKNGSFEVGEDGRRFWLGKANRDVAIGPDPAVCVEGGQSLRMDLPDKVSQSLWQNVTVRPGQRC